MSPPPTHPENPFFQKWDTPFGTPPFERIHPEHFLPAFQAGIRRHQQEIRAIVRSRSLPTFRNTVEALEDSGRFLDRVRGVFSTLVEVDNAPGLQEVARLAGPLLSAHQDSIHHNALLFRRIQSVRAAPPPGLSPEALTLLQRTHAGFLRGGAALPADAQARLRSLHAELEILCRRFEENLQRETQAFEWGTEDLSDLEGLTTRDLAMAQEAARMSDQGSPWVFTLRDAALWPLLAHARNRELRRRMLCAHSGRCGSGSPWDNTSLASRIASLRCEKARLLGYRTYAHYALEDSMAGIPGEVLALLDEVWRESMTCARGETAALQKALEEERPGARLEPWDWRHYAERSQLLDPEEVCAHFPLEQVRTGAFRIAHRLFGITFNERTDIPAYHPEVRTFLVQDRDGSLLGIFFADYLTRPGKRGGAWMETLRRQGVLEGREIRPLVCNVANFSRPAPGHPVLLRLPEVRALFHEFGHALHALLSRCRYRSLSGVATALDFSELPSQIMEQWATEPQALALYAFHHGTGEPLPESLANRIHRSQQRNQGLETLEYLASAYLDLAWHSLESPRPVESAALEAEVMGRIGLPAPALPRYRSPCFSHSLGGEYASGYYAYLWSSILASDAFEAFLERGDLFDPAMAQSFRTHILERGGAMDPGELFRRFRGREPRLEPFLRRRGLA